MSDIFVLPRHPLSINKTSSHWRGLVFWALPIASPTSYRMVDMSPTQAGLGTIVAGSGVTVGYNEFTGQHSNFNNVSDGSLYWSHNNQFVLTDEITIVMWMRLNSILRWGWMVAKVNGTGIDYGIRQVGDLDGSIDFRLGSTTSHAAANTFTTNTWYQVVGTWRKSDSNLKIFSNGVEVAYDGSRATSSSSIPNSSLPLRIGAGDTGNYMRSIADIGEVRIYNRVMSDEEIWQLYEPQTRWELLKLPKNIYNVTTVAAPITIDPSYTQGVASAESPTVVVGSLAIDPSYTQGIASAESATVVVGSLAIDPSYTQGIASAESATVVISGGGLTITVGYAQGVTSAESATVVMGSLAIDPSYTQGVTSAESVTVVMGSLAIDPSYTQGVASAESPTITIITGDYYDYDGTISDYELFNGAIADYELFNSAISDYELFNATMEDIMPAQDGTIAKKLTLTNGDDNTDVFAEPDSVTFYVEYPNASVIAYVYLTDSEVSKPIGTTGIYILKIIASQSGDAYVQAKAVWTDEDWTEIPPREKVIIHRFIGA